MAKKKSEPSGVSASAQKIWLAGLGALATAEEEGSKMFHNLVSKGQKYQTSVPDPFGRASRKVRGSVSEWREKAGRTFRKVEDVFDEQVSSALKRIGVPSRKEIAALSKRVERLNQQLAGSGRAAPTRKKKTAGKATSRRKTASA